VNECIRAPFVELQHFAGFWFVHIMCAVPTFSKCALNKGDSKDYLRISRVQLRLICSFAGRQAVGHLVHDANEVSHSYASRLNIDKSQNHGAGHKAF